MSDPERLHEIIDTLPPPQVHALLALLVAAEAEEDETVSHGELKRALKGAPKGHYRLRVGRWRVFFSLDPPGSVVASDIDNRGQAY